MHEVRVGAFGVGYRGFQGCLVCCGCFQLANTGDVIGMRHALAQPHAGSPNRPRTPNHDQSSVASRNAAALSGFVLLIQFSEAPDLYGALRRFETMPSSPILQA